MPTKEDAVAVKSPPVERIRADFPALDREHNGHAVAYFDGPGGTQVPRQVAAAMSDYLFHHNANTHWRYPTSAETDAALDAARVTLADFLGARSDEIAFGNNMSTLTFHLSRALGRAWGVGDEIVVTELDHHANVDTWRALAVERGVTIRTVPMRPATGDLDEADVCAAIGPRTRLVAIGAASNALGTINDVRRVADRAHAAGALVFVDAVHYAAHELVDVHALGADFLACSAYKFYGPHLGVLYGRRDLVQALSVPKLVPAPEEAPERLETGTQNHEGIVGAAAAVDYLASLDSGEGTRRERLRRGMLALHEHTLRLLERLWTGLDAIPTVRLFGRAPGAGPRTATLSFIVEEMPADDVSTALAERGLFLSSGDFYATTVIERLGQTAHGVVRAGLACYSTEDEVDRLVDAVRDLRPRRRV